MASTKKSVSLWLTAIHHDETHQFLANAIKEGGGPKFWPHITLHTFESNAPLADIVQAVKSLSATAAPLSINFDSLVLGSAYFTSVYLRVCQDDKAKLQQYKNKAEELFGPELLHRKEFMPHLSLHYGEEETRKIAYEKISALVKPETTTYTVTGIEVVYFDGPVESWKSVARVILGSTNAFYSLPYINGEYVNPREGKLLPVINPATREIIHYVASCTEPDINAAVEAAKAAFPSWSNTPAAERARILTEIANVITSWRNELAECETIDNGKVLKESLMDIDDTAACFQYYAKEILRLEKEQDAAIDVENPQFSCYIRHEPVGVCGLIIPFNYPLLMAAWKVAPCLAAGCTAVLKPSEFTPLTALQLAAICEKVGLPPGVLNIIPGGPEAGAPLTTHPDVRKIAFTGSVNTGARVLEAGARSVKNVTLELGGKSAIIVFEDANLEQVVDWVTVGIFMNQGQVCSATSRLLVHESIKEKLLERLVDVAKSIKVGNGLDPQNTMGPIVSERQWHRVNDYIDKGIAEGATLVVGGKVTDMSGPLSKGYFVHPTIFDNVTPDMTIWNEEIFGPVLCVRTFSTENEAIEAANSTEYGLAAAVMSSDPERLKRVARQLQAGVVWLNCSQPTFVQAPWGGMKKSGVGRELGPWGLQNYLEIKQVAQWVDEKEIGWRWFV